MVDFRKRLNRPKIELETNPIEIYKTLDRRSIAGPLRPAQQKILLEYYENYQNEKDLIVKLHTGEGKTLIGLLILQSRINSNKGPCLYICPNKYLVEQVQKDAKKFGINYCTIGHDNLLPNEFLEGKTILITHVQKVFNGKTIFGLGNNFTQADSVILDDSHACIDSIRDSFTININCAHPLYKILLELFRDSLIEQGHGTFLEIENGDYSSFLPIPYWSWINKSEELLRVISEYRNDKTILFSWPFIKDNITNCQAFVSGNNIEISPIHIPIEKFSTFHRAEQRILMSATTQDDSFFIKGLGFSEKSILNPLSNPDQIWSGEKMLIIPYLIDERMDRTTLVNILAKPNARNYGVVSLVPSFPKAKLYGDLGSITPNSNEIPDVVNQLKNGNFEKTVVFANRYDGIDLPDDTCRILIIDGKPYFHSLSDRYEESNRINSDLINVKIAQKIEQGLGRSVRGEKDYSQILICGSDLIKFIKSSKTKKYFSPQTQKQIEIGMDIVKMASEDMKDSDHPFEVVRTLINQSLKRDSGWKEFYTEEMNSINVDPKPNNIHKTLIKEREAALLNNMGKYEEASLLIQEIIDQFCANDAERGWYLQIMARYLYRQSKSESNKLQINAFLKSNELLKPLEGISYKKLEFISENRIRRMRTWIKTHSNYEDLIISLNGILSDLEFGVESSKFEAALKELGELLGFLSERPDKEFKKGPDNLWCGVSNQYFLFECKSEVKIERQEINKHEAAQMNTHSGWFQNEYGDEIQPKRILIIPTKNLSYNADFTHHVEIMRRGKLRSLRTNVKSFFKELSKFEIDSISDDKFQELVNFHDLSIESLKTKYSENHYHKQQ